MWDDHVPSVSLGWIVEDVLWPLGWGGPPLLHGGSFPLHDCGSISTGAFQSAQA